MAAGQLDDPAGGSGWLVLLPTSLASPGRRFVRCSGHPARQGGGSAIRRVIPVPGIWPVDPGVIPLAVTSRFQVERLCQPGILFPHWTGTFCDLDPCTRVAQKDPVRTQVDIPEWIGPFLP